MSKSVEPGSRIRLNLAVSSDVKARLEALQECTSADSMTEVIRRALAVYERLVELDAEGYKLRVIDANGDDQGKLWIVPG